MIAYLLRRVVFGCVLIFLATIISFTLLKISPGAAGADDLNPRQSREYQEEQRRRAGLDRHPVQQYLDWVGVGYFIERAQGKSHEDAWKGLLQGSLGTSIKYDQPVGDVILSRIGPTLALNLMALTVTWLIAVPLGVYAALNYQRLGDAALSTVGFMGMSLPGFFLALCIIWIFSLNLGLLPSGGLRSLDHTQAIEKNNRAALLEREMRAATPALGEETRAAREAEIERLRREAQAHLDTLPWGPIGDYAHHMIMPVLVLAVGSLASLQRIMRSNMIETLRQQYVTTARAKGLSENKVVFKHALRNAINPLVTILGLELAVLFTGAAILENVISFPGMGQLMLEALRAKDQPLVMANFLIASTMLVIGNLVADVLLAIVDPRVTYS